MSKNFFVSEFEARHKLKVLNIFFAVLGNIIHLENVFDVILALMRASGMLFFLALIIKFGQISESTKKITSGLHKDKKSLIKKSTSIGRNL